MATYLYRCADCGHEEDLEFPMGKAPVDIEASDHQLRLQIMVSAIHVPNGTKAGYVKR